MRVPLILLVCFALMNCESNDPTLDCSAVTCLALNYHLRLTDDSGENWILVEQLSESDIRIINSENEVVDSTILNGEIIVYPKNEKNGKHNLTIKNFQIEYSFNFTGGGTNCCDFGNLSDVVVESKEFIVRGNLLEIFL